MEVKRYFEKLLIILLVLTLTVLGGGFSAFAETEPTETYAIESYVEETTEGVTDVIEETWDTTVLTDPTETSQAETTKPETTYKEPLPEISSEEIVIPSQIDQTQEDDGSLFWGFVAWICVGVGVAVILAVLLTTKTKAIRAGGKKRYSTGDKISGKQRLLNDKYYNKRR